MSSGKVAVIDAGFYAVAFTNNRKSGENPPDTNSLSRFNGSGSGLRTSRLLSIRERPLDSGSSNVSIWPIAAVEFTDVPNHVNCTARQSQPQRAA
jgi:hypothetical protein